MILQIFFNFILVELSNGRIFFKRFDLPYIAVSQDLQKKFVQKENLLQINDFQEINPVLEAGLEPARRLNAKGF